MSQDDITPPHDERFLGYGNTRNSQVYSNVFLPLSGFYILSEITISKKLKTIPFLQQVMEMAFAGWRFLFYLLRLQFIGAFRIQATEHINDNEKYDTIIFSSRHFLKTNLSSIRIKMEILT